MNRILLSFLLLLSYLGTAQNNNMYVGYRANGTGTYSDSLAVFDTIGGSYNLIKHIGLSSTTGNAINGLFGLSLNPTNGEMMAVYREVSASNTQHRLGVLDTITGVISDLGQVGNVNDIQFVGGRLFGNTGTTSTSSFVEIGATNDTSVDVIFDYQLQGGSSAIAYNPYTNTMLKINQGQSYYDIDMNTLTEAIRPTTTSPSWTTGGYFISDSVFIRVGDDDISKININTYNEFDSYTVNNNEYYHSVAFGAVEPYTVIAATGTEFCSNEPDTLSSVFPGSTYQWFLDGTLIPGATNMTYLPSSSGSYACEVDGTLSNVLTINVLNAPNVSITQPDNTTEICPGQVVQLVGASGGDRQWFKDGVAISGQNSDSYFATEPGLYNQVKTNMNGCSDSSAVGYELILCNVGLNENSVVSLNIYPNPVTDLLTVNSNFPIISYRIVDIEGKLINSRNITDLTEIKIETTDLRRGVYFIEVRTINGMVQQKLIK